jgi:hypothetical protein
MEEYKRKKKSDKARRNKELYGKYNSKKTRNSIKHVKMQNESIKSVSSVADKMSR